MSKNESASMSNSEREEYARRIKSLRQSAGMSQAELAEYSRASRQTISNIERGSVVPQEDVLRRILDALGFEYAAPRFDRQTDLWLTMMGTLIEAIPETNRGPVVDRAIRVLADGIKSTGERPVVELRPTNVGSGAHTDGLDIASADEVQESLELPMAARRGKRKADEAPSAE
ncbi:helix-turn-helix domain-containing protein [Rathayibacter sp. VKM Ac-2804]|uniref:helix-turn-helix domain-containing protein n=1 Tax=Rathayibacter sp. VKM Ac-2804 TaxID=2609257 RepID=UPI00132E9E85|nr:helix-turn-helix transcriptional regulator [Rathayibacter sp. VKM Ac-2804]QHF24127.1 helix-turn-helix domain-containing protein [Rathayibacter sp. VKM Ac-2804]